MISITCTRCHTEGVIRQKTMYVKCLTCGIILTRPRRRKDAGYENV